MAAYSILGARGRTSRVSSVSAPSRRNSSASWLARAVSKTVAEDKCPLLPTSEDVPAIQAASESDGLWHPPETERRFEVTLERAMAHGPLGISVVMWEGRLEIGDIAPSSPAAKEGSLIPGDVVQAVDGTQYSTIDEVAASIRSAGKKVVVSVTRCPVSTKLTSKVRMKLPDGAWEDVRLRLLSDRTMELEKSTPPQYSRTLDTRTATSLTLIEDSDGQVLHAKMPVDAGHEAFEIRTDDPKELAIWHLRLQEITMLRGKVANVAEGWLYNHNKGGFTEWFVLYSNSVLMCFSDPDHASLGQAQGFIAVEECKGSQLLNKHTIQLKSRHDSWTLGTDTKETMLEWVASLGAAADTKSACKLAHERKRKQLLAELQQGLSSGEADELSPKYPRT